MLAQIEWWHDPADGGKCAICSADVDSIQSIVLVESYSTVVEGRAYLCFLKLLEETPLVCDTITDDVFIHLPVYTTILIVLGDSLPF